MLQDFLAEEAPYLGWFRELLEHAEATATREHYTDDERRVASLLVAHLREEVYQAPESTRDTLLVEFLSSSMPSVAAWGAHQLATCHSSSAVRLPALTGQT